MLPLHTAVCVCVCLCARACAHTLLCVDPNEFAFIYEQVFVYRSACVGSSADIELFDTVYVDSPLC